MHGRLKRFGRWGELHEESELLAIEAESLLGCDPNRARELYAQAAVIEEHVLSLFPDNQKHVEFYEALIVSAAALHFKGGDHTGSQRVIDEYGHQLQGDYHKARLGEVIEALRKIH